MDTPTKVVAVSGGFDPVHIGHVRMFEEAKKLGDRLVVILNNDAWLVDKKGFVFMPQEERASIIGAFECVDEVVITDHKPGDEDRSVSRALEQIKPQVFANGGDRKEEKDIPEAAICKAIGCEMVFNVGGDKVQSSSWLTGTKKRETRAWGEMETLKSTQKWWIKTLRVAPGEMLSLQKHSHRSEVWVCIAGHGTAELGGQIHDMTPGKVVWFSPGIIHRLSSDIGCTIVEVAHGDVMSETDIKRYEDKYGRI